MFINLSPHHEEVEDKTVVVYGRVGAEWAEDQQKRKCSRRGCEVK